MKFFVNFLSAFRIAASFAIIPTLMFQMYWTSLILFVLAALSDFFDGFLADIMVQSKIKKGQEDIDNAICRVEDLLVRLRTYGR